VCGCKRRPAQTQARVGKQKTRLSGKCCPHDRTGALYLLMLWLAVLWCGFPGCLGTISVTVTRAGVKGSWQSEKQGGHVSRPFEETVVTEDEDYEEMHCHLCLPELVGLSESDSQMSSKCSASDESTSLSAVSADPCAIGGADFGCTCCCRWFLC